MMESVRKCGLMTRKQLVQEVRKRFKSDEDHKVRKRDIEQIAEIMLDTISGWLESKMPIQLRGIGSFEPFYKRGNYYDFRTRKPIEGHKSFVYKFKLSDKVKQFVESEDEKNRLKNATDNQ